MVRGALVPDITSREANLCIMTAATSHLAVLETICNKEYGPQEVYLDDPYVNGNVVQFSKCGDLTDEQLRKVFSDDLGTWRYCSTESVRRLLPELLRLWELSIRSDVNSCNKWNAKSPDFYYYYFILYDTKILRGPDTPARITDAAVKHVESVVNTVLCDVVQRRASSYEIGGDDFFMRHFNSCAAILRSVENLWEMWWECLTPGAILEAFWFLETIRGGFGPHQPMYVDTRDLSSHCIYCEPPSMHFWSEESTAFLRSVDWARNIETLLSSGKSAEWLPESKISSIIHERSEHLRSDDEVFQRRFDIYLREASQGKNWTVWQEVDT